MGSHRDAEREELRKDVALMRELGVPLWSRPNIGEIRLGPPPQPEAKPRTLDEERAHRDREEERKRETLFAATSIRPVMPETEASQRASVLKSVVPLREKQEHDRGPTYRRRNGER